MRVSQRREVLLLLAVCPQVALLENATVWVEPLLFAMDDRVAAILVSLSLPNAESGSGAKGQRTPAVGSVRTVTCCNAHPHVTLWTAQEGMAKYLLSLSLSLSLYARRASRVEG